MRRPRISMAIDAAAYGLLTWHFFTAAGLLLTSSVAFAMRLQPEVLVAAPGGLFLAYIGVQLAHRFERAIRGDSFLF